MPEIEEQVVTDSDKALADLERARRKRAAVKVNKNWVKVIGTIPDDAFAREAWALGEAWRKAQTTP